MADLMDDERAFEVVTEALRAGPGSPAWREAMELAGGAHGDEGDEGGLLREMRERLESGRRYREIRAGAGFTRKVMDAVEQEAAGKSRHHGLPLASFVIVLSAAAILIVVGIVGYMIRPSAP